MASPGLILISLLAVGFSLATWLEPRWQSWASRGARGDNMLALLLGDGRRMFADHFFTKADVYFHGGYYPSVFDQARGSSTTAWLTEQHDEHDTSEPDAHEHEKAMDFLGQPKDWIDRFGRHFYVTEHSHLEGGSSREILPWLRLSAELDPARVETYTVAAYWLRKHLGKAKEAETFLRDGLRANPDSFEILLELGRLYYENQQDPIRARNVCELALRKWEQQEPGKTEPDWLLYREITVYLARLEEKENNPERAVRYLEMLKKSPLVPANIQQQINELKQKSESLSIPSAP